MKLCGVDTQPLCCVSTTQTKVSMVISHHYSHDFLLRRERLRVLGLDDLSEGFWVTDLTSRSMISSVASSCPLAPSSLATDMVEGLTLPRPGEWSHSRNFQSLCSFHA